jgi:hypothetical protein
MQESNQSRRAGSRGTESSASDHGFVYAPHNL